MSVDPLKIKKHAKVRLKDSPAPVEIHGVYLSNAGIVAMVKQNRDSIVSRNVLLSDLEEVVDDGK